MQCRVVYIWDSSIHFKKFGFQKKLNELEIIKTMMGHCQGTFGCTVRVQIWPLKLIGSNLFGFRGMAFLWSYLFFRKSLDRKKTSSL